jgi:hypothetical protein
MHYINQPRLVTKQENTGNITSNIQINFKHKVKIWLGLTRSYYTENMNVSLGV